MDLIIEQNHEDMSRRAATIIADEIRKKPDLVLAAKRFIIAYSDISNGNSSLIKNLRKGVFL